jgi:hypothetical protein
MDIFSRVLDFDLSATDTFAMALIASGMITCFFGYRLFKVVLAIAGFVTGGALAWTVLTAAGYGQWVTIAGTLLAALVGSVAMFSLFSAGVFLFGCALGLLMAVVILSAIGSELNVVVVSIFVLVYGLVTLWFRKVLVVASTALTGAWSVLSGVTYFVGDLDLIGALAKPELFRTEGGMYYAVLALWLLIGISGIAIQMRTQRKRERWAI